MTMEAKLTGERVYEFIKDGKQVSVREVYDFGNWQGDIAREVHSTICCHVDYGSSGVIVEITHDALVDIGSDNPQDIESAFSNAAAWLSEEDTAVCAVHYMAEW